LEIFQPPSFLGDLPNRGSLGEGNLEDYKTPMVSQANRGGGGSTNIFMKTLGGSHEVILKTLKERASTRRQRAFFKTLASI